LTFPLEDCSEFGNFVITLIYIWTKKGTQGELDWSSLTGSDYKKRSSFLNLYRFVTLEIHEFSNIEDIFEKCKGWVNDFLALGSGLY
jgi:hypothetical protein